MSWQLVTDHDALTAAIADLRRGRDVAVDTEFMLRDTYYPQVALLQLCSGETAWLIDPLPITDTGPIRELLVDPTVVKVIHSCSEDLEVFRHWLGVLPRPLIDTQRAAALLGEDFGLGYRALVEKLLGVELEKGETRSNWLQRPLSDSQCHYAAQDVLQLMPAWRLLRERAEETGRMGWLFEEGDDAIGALAAREEELARRVKGAGRLSRREFEVLRRLCDWREERARTLDRPRGWVLADKACLAIARDRPRHREALAQLDVLPPAVLRRLGDRLIELVEAAEAVPEAELPAASPAPLVPTQRDRLKILRERVPALAASLGVAPEAACSGAELELLLREAAGEAIREPPRWTGWRRDAVLTPLRAEIAAMAEAS